jgi:hypothetical protein
MLRSLSRSGTNLVGPRGLVRRSAGMELVFRYLSWTTCCLMRSRMKWWRTKMWRDLREMAGAMARLIADMLSSQIVVGSGCG